MPGSCRGRAQCRQALWFQGRAAEQSRHRSRPSAPTSRHYGPPTLRKLLYLAACSVRTHKKQFQQYFFRKLAEGKHKKLVLNNIQNKILKIACAVVRSQQPYIANYVSVNPLVFQKTLTAS